VIPNTGLRGIAWWANEVAAADRITEALMAEMEAQPRFAEAAYGHIRESVALFGRNPIVSRLATDGVRLALGYLSLYMDARGGLTRQAVRELFGGLGLSSPGRAAAMLIHLRFINFIEPAREQPDRRTKLYVPTTGMKRAFSDLMKMGFEVTALVEPETANIIPQFEEPLFFKGFVLAMGEAILTMFQRLEGVPRNMLADTTAGYMMLYRLMLGGREDVYPPHGELPLELSALAKEFGVARSHVRRTFRHAVQLEHMRYSQDGKSVILCAPFREHLAQHHAAMFINNLRCIHQASEYVARHSASHKSPTKDRMAGVAHASPGFPVPDPPAG
jgi:hypothetical protein